MKRLLVLLFVTLLSAPAFAQDSAQVAEARRFFDAGRQAYEAGQYLVAATAFEEAMRLAPRPPVVFSMAQAYRKQYFVDRDPAKLKRAIELYRRYLDEVGEGGRRDDCVQYVSELEPLLARIEDEQKKKGMGPIQAMAPRAETTQLMISSRTPGAKARLDDAPAAEAPLIREVAAGKHTIVVEADGHFPETLEGTAVEGRLVAVEVTLREKPALLKVRAPDDAEIAVDGRPVGETPLSRPLELSAGRHFVTVAKRGHRVYSREITVERGQATELAAPLEPTGQRQASTWVLGAAGVTLLAAATTTTLAFVHQSRAEDILDDRDSGPITSGQLDDYGRERDKRDQFRDASYLLYGGAAVLLGTGLALYLVDSPRVEAPPATPALTPTVGSDGTVGMSLTRHF